MHGQTHCVIDQGAEDDQTQEAPVPPPVEQVARGDYDRVLQLKLSSRGPVDEKDEREESPEGE